MPHRYPFSALPERGDPHAGRTGVLWWVPVRPWTRGTNPDGSRPTEWNHPTSLAATEVGRAPQTQAGENGQSWMVQLYIRLLTGRFQVRILVAEPAELEIGRF